MSQETKLLEAIRPRLKLYAVAIAPVAIVLLLTQLLQPAVSFIISSLFLAAVATSAYYSGLFSGLLATALAVVAHNYFFIPPLQTLAIEKQSDAMQLLIFCVIALLITGFNAELRLTKQRTEASLEKLQASYQSLLNAANEGIWLINTDAQIESANQRLADLLGYSLEEIVGCSLFDFIEEQDRLKAQQNIQQGIKDPFDIRCRHKTGLLVWTQISIHSLRSEDGETSGSIVMLTDKTEIKRSQEVLYQQALALENIYDGIIITDSEGLIIQWNPSAERMFGYSQEEALGKPLAFLQKPEESAVLTQQIFEGIQSADRWAGEIHFIRKNGLEGFCESIFVSLYDDEGKKIGAIGVNHDITDQKHAEAEICKVLEKERELSELKSRFVTMASHEFRTPLATILVSSDLLKAFSHQFSDEKKLQHLNKIQLQVKHMVQLLEDILYFEKMEVEPGGLISTPLNLEAVCQEILAEVEMKSGKQHLFQFHFQGENSIVEMNQILLRQMLNNLIAYAIKCFPLNSLVNFKVTCSNQKVIFQIKNENGWIAQPPQECLFEGFNPASKIWNNYGKRMGLAMLKDTVHLQGGNITCENEIGLGINIKVSIPMLQIKDKHI